MWFYAETDGDGRFELPGLLPRAYRLRALDVGSLVLSESGPLLPGAEPVELRLDTGAVARVAGRVQALDGTPLEGLSVHPGRTVLELDTPWLPRDWSTNLFTDGVTTGPGGAFELRALTREGLVLAVEGERIFPVEVSLPPGHDPGRVVIGASRLAHLRVVATDPGRAPDRFAALDARGRPTVMLRRSSATGVLHPWGAITGGASVVTSVREDVVAVLLHRGDEELARVPVRLAPGETATVAWP